MAKIIIITSALGSHGCTSIPINLTFEVIYFAPLEVIRGLQLRTTNSTVTSLAVSFTLAAL